MVIEFKTSSHGIVGHEVTVLKEEVSSVHEPPRMGVGVVIVMKSGRQIEVSDNYREVCSKLGW